MDTTQIDEFDFTQVDDLCQKDDLCADETFQPSSHLGTLSAEEAKQEPEEPCCPVCSNVWTPKDGIVKREQHVEKCLARINGGSIESKGKILCPICSGSFTTLHAAELHIDSCLEEQLKIKPNQTHSLDFFTGSEQGNNSHCPVCCATLPKKLGLRVKHIKGCASKSQIRGPKDLEVKAEEDSLQMLLDEIDRQEQTDIKQALKIPAGSNAPFNADTFMVPSITPNLKKITHFFSSATSTISTTSSEGSPVPNVVLKKARLEAEPPREPDKPWQACPYYKRIPDSNVVVDGFQYAHPDLTQVYVLSHFHYDHYIGLTKNFNAGTIFCSATTARLVGSVLKVSRHRIRIIPIAEPFELPDGTRVTALDANHAPGSCVFVFQTKGGKLFVHTGDFRATDALSKRIREISLAKGRPVDTVFLDTTYCDEQYNFLPQESVIDLCRQAVEGHLKARPRTLVVFGSYTIGKERIALACVPEGGRLVVSKAKLNIVRCYDYSASELSVFTTNRALSPFWVVTMADLDIKRLDKIRRQYSTRFDNILAVRATGWVKTFKTIKESQTITSLFVPYSEHSSFGELKRFVRYVNPRNVVPTVWGKGRTKEEMLRLLCY